MLSACKSFGFVNVTDIDTDDCYLNFCYKSNQLIYCITSIYGRSHTYKRQVSFSGKGKVHCNKIKCTVHCFARHQLPPKFIADIAVINSM